MTAPAQWHTRAIGAPEFVHKQAGFLTILYLLGILQLVQTYTTQQWAKHGTTTKDVTPLQPAWVPLQLGHVITLLKKCLDAFLGWFLNPYSLDIKGWFTMPIIFHLVFQYSGKMCPEVSNGLDTLKLTVGTGVRERDFRQSSKPGLRTIEDCLIAKGKNTPKVSGAPLSISWKQMVEEFRINSPAGPSLTPAPCRDDQPFLLTACETALHPRGSVCAQEPPCK